MKLNLFILMQLSAFLFSDAFAQSISQQSIFNIIPQPVKIQPAQGMFNLDTTVKIEVSSSDKEVWKTAYLFSKKILVPTGYHLKVVGTVTKKEKAICLVLNTIPDDVLGKEGYVLEVNPDRINIRANKPAGIFYGIQTLMQILPPGIENKSKITHENWNIHCVSILDYPRFGWRGLMLDVSRHFFQKGFVEKYIDQMAKYKYNVFHWHLTDDNGWRIEINGLPKLTKIGAWRAPRTGDWGSFDIAQPGEKATYGGYYTQEDIKEIVEYARERFVTIVPEVDVPAHSLALIASYPNLSCTQLQYQVGVGRIKNTVDNVLCVANDSTWLLLNKIFTQIAALFPGQYIHVGGDEAYKGFWEQHWKDRALMKREGLGNTKELQSYFEKKLEKLIISKGKKMIGWDEILEGGLAPEATVMSWRGMQGGIEASKLGHHVIMTPDSNCYLNEYQGDSVAEPPSKRTLRLNTCYEFEPVPDGVDSKFILGGQGNLWTEFVPNERHAEYMTWPRSLALAEILWSQKDASNWPGFIHRMEAQLPRFDAAQIKYARSFYQAIITPVKDNMVNDSMRVQLDTEIPGLDIYYTFDDTNPDKFYQKYNGQALIIPMGAKQINVVTYRGEKLIGKQINMPLEVLKKRMK